MNNSASIKVSFDINDIITTHHNTKSYASIHNWLRKMYGAAHRCENSQCTNPSSAFQWAKVKGCDYDYKRENFIMLCGRCHYYYDEKFKRHQKLKANYQGTFAQLQLFNGE
mgnify:CR=1 FL=1